MILVSEYSESYFLSDINPNNPDNDWDIEDSLTYETEYENEPLAFRDLVKYLCDEGFTNPNDSVITSRTGISTGQVEDYRTGMVTKKTIFFSKDNNPRLAKYWVKAVKTAMGSVK
jgi:hypothetical protein